MINWNSITGFDWDDGNSRKNVEKHDVSQLDAEQVFFNEPLLGIDDTKHSKTETRFHAFGKTNDKRELHIIFILRQGETLIRVIFARDMHRKERNAYEQS